MKKTWKKITSLFLSLLLMLSMVVTPVMAAEAKEMCIRDSHRVNKKISGQIQKILQGFLLDQHQMKVFVPDIKIMKNLQNPIEHQRKRLIGI